MQNRNISNQTGSKEYSDKPGSMTRQGRTVSPLSSDKMAAGAAIDVPRRHAAERMMLDLIVGFRCFRTLGISLAILGLSTNYGSRECGLALNYS